MEWFLLVKCEGGCYWQHKNDEDNAINWRRRCLDCADEDTADEKPLLTSYWEILWKKQIYVALLFDLLHPPYLVDQRCLCMLNIQGGVGPDILSI